MSATAELDRSPDEYFHLIEETFIRLRGAPLLLSPADWQTARAWHEERIPAQLVGRVMEEMFARLRERDPERKIYSLRYCAPAVEAAWREVRDLGATEGRLEPLPVDVSARLQGLVESLPTDLPGRSELVTELLALSGEAESVESRLHEIEQRFLEGAAENLEPEVRAQLDERIARALSKARSRVSAAELPELEHRLLHELVRQRLGLATLSLFSESDSEI